MEYLPLSLTDCLKRYPNIPDYITIRILLDVAKGLHFLHNRREPIIHRDLTANNVLLSDTMRAKIADLGVARILSDQLRTMTKVPGNATYMPPEAFSGAPKYDKSLDIFSFGVLILHTVNHEWPHPNQDLFERSPTNPRKCTQVPETKRRAAHLEKMGKNHQLMGLTVRCLDDDPNARPSTFDLVQEFEGFASLSPPPYANSMEMLQAINSKSEENRRLEVQNHGLKVKERELETANHDMSTQIEAQGSRVSALEQDLRDTRVLLNMKEREVATKMEEISTKDSVLEARRREVESLGLELRLLRHSHPEEVCVREYVRVPLHSNTFLYVVASFPGSPLCEVKWHNCKQQNAGQCPSNEANLYGFKTDQICYSYTHCSALLCTICHLLGNRINRCTFSVYITT